jgi:hypothetical protein
MSSVLLRGVSNYAIVEGITTLHFNIQTDSNESYEWCDLAIIPEGTSLQGYLEANIATYLSDIEAQSIAWAACGGEVTIKNIDGNDIVVTLTKQQYIKPTLPTHKTLLERVKDIEGLLN